MVITHDHAIAERMPRTVEILDGQIVADTAADTDLGPLAGPAARFPHAPSATTTGEKRT